MFDGLLGRKFSNKCKHSIKGINCRIVPIRKKKEATLNYLKRVVAELLSKGDDANALGRMDALIVEMNHTSCYEIIEQYCGCILQQLPLLQKQRECPEEATEALSTLIFAAARFSDLPELCDLRHVFIERYGRNIESYANTEFVEKMQKKCFPRDKKLQLMQDIAQEFSVSWDPKAFQQKRSNPPHAPASNQPKRTTPISNGNEELLHMEINGRKEEAVTGKKVAATNAGNAEVPSKGRSKPLPRSVVQKQHVQPELKDIHVIPSIRNGRPHDLTDKTRKMTVDDEPENVEPHTDNTGVPPYVKSKGSQNGTHKDVQLNEGTDHSRSPKAQVRLGLIGLEKQAVGPAVSRDVKAVNMIPPYTKSKGLRNGMNSEEPHDGGSAYDELPRRAKEGSDPTDQERQPVRPAFNMIPPYTKPKLKNPPALAENDKPIDIPIRSSNTEDYEKSNVCLDKDVQEDKLFADERAKPISVRRKHPKPPVVGEVDSVIHDGYRTLSDRNKGGRQSAAMCNDGYIEEEKIADRRHRQTINEIDGAINPGRHMTRTPSGRRRQGSRRDAAATYDGDCDEEEAVMDRLLIHYSKKGMSNESSKMRSRTRAPPTDLVVDAVKVVEGHHHHHHGNGKIHHGTEESVVNPPQRAISLPPEPISPTEEGVVKGHARSASMQPDMLNSNGGRVHPKLPDYDELAARLIALRKA